MLQTDRALALRAEPTRRSANLIPDPFADSRKIHLTPLGGGGGGGGSRGGGGGGGFGHSGGLCGRCGGSLRGRTVSSSACGGGGPRRWRGLASPHGRPAASAASGGLLIKNHETLLHFVLRFFVLLLIAVFGYHLHQAIYSIDGKWWGRQKESEYGKIVARSWSFGSRIVFPWFLSIIPA